MRDIIQAVAMGEVKAERLRDRRRDCLVVRVPIVDQCVVVKLWKRRGIRSALRNFSRTGNRHREWKALKFLSTQGMNVPRPLDHFRLQHVGSPFTEALVMQDMGNCVRAVNFLKCLFHEDRVQERLDFEAEVIEMTQQLICGYGFLDTDHHLNNIVVQPNGRLARLDLELARRVKYPRAFPKTYRQMIESLVHSYVIACEANMEPVRDFNERLLDRLQLSSSLRIVASGPIQR